MKIKGDRTVSGIVSKKRPLSTDTYILNFCYMSSNVQCNRILLKSQL